MLTIICGFVFSHKTAHLKLAHRISQGLVFFPFSIYGPSRSAIQSAQWARLTQSSRFGFLSERCPTRMCEGTCKCNRMARARMRKGRVQSELIIPDCKKYNFIFLMCQCQCQPHVHQYCTFEGTFYKIMQCTNALQTTISSTS